MTAYDQGTRYERICALHLEDNGYHVLAGRGSHGLADLVALKIGQTLLLQVKKGRALVTAAGAAPTNGLTHEEWNGLYDLARTLGAVPLVADFPSRKDMAEAAVSLGHTPPRLQSGQKWGDRVLRYSMITARHVQRSRYWPHEEWEPDYIARSPATLAEGGLG